MSRINVLDSKIFNRIAAGEVVERPFSVVKELVENSLDSGAKNIVIEISKGGRAFVRVSDDGCGIDKDDLKKAVLPHATSKISRIEDLDNIISLGFRGEALASIASVSKLTIISKTKGQDLGSKLYTEGGVIGEVSECGSAEGTEITVENLFFNTPVREKFLKSERTEENDISAVIARFILGNTTVSFKFISDGKTVYQSFGDGIDSAMLCVYGKGILDNCFFIDTEKNGIKIRGYVGKHFFSKPNRTYQTVFLNGRYIINQTIASAVSNAYSSYLMKRQYPFYVLSIKMPPQEVDVNVHPSKTDVRFSNNQIVYGAIYSVISKVLDGSSEALDIIVSEPTTNNEYLNKNKDDYHSPIATVKMPPNFENKPKEKNTIIFRDCGSTSALSENKGFVLPQNREEGKTPDDIFSENKAYIEKLEKEKNTATSNILEQSKIELARELKYIGQSLNTYLIFDDGADMFFIDQHAAHERILFDKFMEQVKKGTIDVQSLLIPFILDVNEAEFNFLDVKSKLLNQMGIEICEFGKNTFKISALPVYIADMNIGKFFSELLADLNSLKAISIDILLKEKIAQKACKAAIKSGDKLSDNDIKIIMENIKGNLGLKCPHGRPIAVRITRTEIDKWFKRIL